MATFIGLLAFRFSYSMEMYYCDDNDLGEMAFCPPYLVNRNHCLCFDQEER